MLLIAVPTAAVAAARRSDMSRTAAGAAMHVALGSPERIIPRGFASSAYVRAEPESWEALLAWATAAGKTMPGEGSRKRPSAQRATRLAGRLDRELQRLAMHPAYRGLAVDGVDTSVLPARRKAGDDRWWPTTRLALKSSHGEPDSIEVTELEPHMERLRGRVFTVWIARP